MNPLMSVNKVYGLGNYFGEWPSETNSSCLAGLPARAVTCKNVVHSINESTNYQITELTNHHPSYLSQSHA
jgi:hypothetical protein